MQKRKLVNEIEKSDKKHKMKKRKKHERSVK